MSNATPGNFPAVNPGALYFLPTENQWYKAVYYKGGGTNAGYWDYGTGSDTPPTTVTADMIRDDDAGNTGDFAIYNSAGDWNGLAGNVTAVGLNGGPSAYGAFDMNGNAWEWNDLTGASAGSPNGLRGGAWDSNSSATFVSTQRYESDPSTENNTHGFRLAAVPEPSTWVMGLAGLVCGGSFVRWRRKRA